jgi:hypothetical protein
MWKLICTYAPLKTYSIALVLSLIAGLEPALAASSYAPLQPNHYIALPLLLAVYHLVLFFTNRTHRLHLKLAGFAVAIAVSFSQPNEIVHLLHQPTVYVRDLGWITMLVVPAFLLFGVHFLKKQVHHQWLDHLFWGMIATYVFAVSAHFLHFYSHYIAWLFIASTTLLVAISLTRSFTANKLINALFGVGFLVWLSIFVVNAFAPTFHYYEVPLMLMTAFFSGATIQQYQQQTATLYLSENNELKEEVHTQAQTIDQQQTAIHEKDKIIRVKEKRLQTNKSILEKAGRRLKEKERVLKLQNQQITKSIEYARNIQDAILPTEQALKQLFKDYFVLFRPKDIV